MPTTLQLAPSDFQTFLRPCTYTRRQGWQYISVTFFPTRLKCSPKTPLTWSTPRREPSQRTDLHFDKFSSSDKKLLRCTIVLQLEFLKYSSEEISYWSCKCSILLGFNFVKIKISFTKMRLFFNSKNFKIICYWKKAHESEPIQCFNASDPFFL